jgi:hypothetical protein
MCKGKFVIPFGGIKMGNPRVGDMGLWTECWKGSMELIEKPLGIYEETESIEGIQSKVRSFAKNAKNNFSMALILSRPSKGVHSKKPFLRGHESTSAALLRFRSSALYKSAISLLVSSRNATSSASRPRLTSTGYLGPAMSDQTSVPPSTT